MLLNVIVRNMAERPSQIFEIPRVHSNFFTRPLLHANTGYSGELLMWPIGEEKLYDDDDDGDDGSFSPRGRLGRTPGASASDGRHGEPGPVPPPLPLLGPTRQHS